MKGFFVRSSRVTPSIYFNPKKHLLDIRGKCSPENPIDFYNLIQLNIDQFAKKSNRKLTINLAYSYFNTSSSKCIFNLLKKLDALQRMGIKVDVNWFYEAFDDDMKESGMDLASFFNMKFNFVAIPEINALGIQKKKSTEQYAA